MLTEEVTDLEFDVPEEESPVECPYCDRLFRSERYATFHVGYEHADVCTPAEREEFDDQRDDEEFDLFTFHAKVVVVVLVTYFTFTYFYALSLGG